MSLCLTYGLGALADRIHPLRATMIAVALYGLATLWGGFFAVSRGSYAVALLAHGVFAGVYNTVSPSLGQRLLPRENYAQISSAGGIVGAMINIILPPVLGIFLDLGHHDYRLTFLAASGLSFAALGCLAVVHHYWMKLGGPHHFVPPP